MIPDIESFRLVPHMTNIIECLNIPKFSHDPGVARKWYFSTSGGAANLGGVSGDLFEHRGSGIPLLEITSLFMHKLTGLYSIVLYRVEITPVSSGVARGGQFAPGGTFKGASKLRLYLKI